MGEALAADEARLVRTALLTLMRSGRYASYQELADALGITRSNVSQICRSKHAAGFTTAYHVAHLLGIDVQELLGQRPSAERPSEKLRLLRAIPSPKKKIG